MKALIISDIHSNFAALEAIIKMESDADLIYCAGDLIDYGPCPAEVIEWAIEHQIVAVKGNHDIEAIETYYSGRRLSEVKLEERTWLDYNLDRLDKSHINYLESLPEAIKFNMDGYHYLLKHSFVENSYHTINNIFHFNQLWSSYYESDSNVKERRFICGHTHEAAIHYVDDRSLWINPGSISYRNVRQTSDLSKDSQYITISDGKLEMKRLSYNISTMYDLMSKWQVKSTQVGQVKRFFKA